MIFRDYERCFSKIRKGDRFFTKRGGSYIAQEDAYLSGHLWVVDGWHCLTDFFITKIEKKRQA